MTSDESSKIRLLVVHPHETTRAGVRTVLGQWPTIEIVGEAGTAADGITAARRLAPDVVMTDSSLPDASGIAVCREVRAACERTRVIFFTSSTERGVVLGAVLAGADGYLLKQIDGHDLAGAIVTVAQGGSILDPAITRTVVDHVRSLQHMRNMRALQTDTRALPLTPKEGQVLALVAQGKTNSEIATALELRYRTVKRDLSGVFKKIGVKRRSEAAASFARLGKERLDGPRH